jgi:uncharacterized membrane protein
VQFILPKFVASFFWEVGLLGGRKKIKKLKKNIDISKSMLLQNNYLFIYLFIYLDFLQKISLTLEHPK